MPKRRVPRSVTGAPALRYFATVVKLPPREGAPQGEVASAIAEIDDEDLACRSESWHAPYFNRAPAPTF